VCCFVSTTTLPRVNAVANGSRPTAATEPAASSRETVKPVKPSLASRSNVKLSSRKSAVRHQDADADTHATKPVSRQSVSSKPSVIATKTQPPPPSSSTSVSNQRRSVTSQYLKSATDRRRTLQLPTATARPLSACDRRRSHQAQLTVKQKTTRQLYNSQKTTHQISNQEKTTHQMSNPQNCRNQNKSGQTQMSSKQKVEMPPVPSCRDRRKSYHAQLLVRQKTVAAAGRKLTPRRRHSNVMSASARQNKLLELSSSKPADGPRISTPSTCRRTAAAMTPSLSCIPQRKTVSFVTSASRKSTPHLHRTLPVKKEMSMR